MKELATSDKRELNLASAEADNILDEDYEDEDDEDDEEEEEQHSLEQLDELALASLRTLPLGGPWLEDRLDPTQFPWAWHENNPVRPLAGALYNSYVRTAEFLLGLGADPNAKAPPASDMALGQNISMLSIALFDVYLGDGHDPRPDLLVNRGANVNETGLLVAAVRQRYSSNALKYLLQHGADPNILDENGYSPFYVAVHNICTRHYRDLTDLISRAVMLLGAGANPALGRRAGNPPADALLIEFNKTLGRNTFYYNRIAALVSMIRRLSGGGVSLRSDTREFGRARNL